MIGEEVVAPTNHLLIFLIFFIFGIVNLFFDIFFIFDIYMACYTMEEIANKVNLHKDTVNERTLLYRNMDIRQKSDKLFSQYQDQDFKIPIYNIWNFAKKTNEVSHFGNSEQTIVDNLLYTFTQPFYIHEKE